MWVWLAPDSPNAVIAAARASNTDDTRTSEQALHTEPATASPQTDSTTAATVGSGPQDAPGAEPHTGHEIDTSEKPRGGGGWVTNMSGPKRAKFDSSAMRAGATCLGKVIHCINRSVDKFNKGLNEACEQTDAGFGNVAHRYGERNAQMVKGEDEWHCIWRLPY
ncbi:hypothetical protein K488DRAFT_67896 [Vararia minispora EC-137]|uniref:Uncharacterized protein n=1 Tax=Vararia minispora EC-137 TaxID=1314806 RepID=A0ACB8QWS0_9AGAM|nr:hypothetical protein K488DRAFT_67896 [Vararia minispora EC-137]